MHCRPKVRDRRRPIDGSLTFAMLLVLAMSLVAALPVFAEGYRFLTRSKRRAATRARLARFPSPDAMWAMACATREVKARYEEVVRIVERRRSRQGPRLHLPHLRRRLTPWRSG